MLLCLVVMYFYDNEHVVFSGKENKSEEQEAWNFSSLMVNNKANINADEVVEV